MRSTFLHRKQKEKVNKESYEILRSRCSLSMTELLIIPFVMTPLLEIKDFGPPTRGGHIRENKLKRNEQFSTSFSPFTPLVPCKRL